MSTATLCTLSSARVTFGRLDSLIYVVNSTGIYYSDGTFYPRVYPTTPQCVGDPMVDLICMFIPTIVAFAVFAFMFIMLLNKP